MLILQRDIPYILNNCLWEYLSVTPGRGEENGPLMALTFPEDSLKSNVWLTYSDFYGKSFSVSKKTNKKK